MDENGPNQGNTIKKQASFAVFGRGRVCCFFIKGEKHEAAIERHSKTL